MKTVVTTLIALFLAASPALALAQKPTSGYCAATLWNDTKAIKWETAATFAGVTLLGLDSWNWGSSNSFKTNPEDWFGKDTGSGGADKLGHAFSSYAVTNLLTERLIKQGRTPGQAALSSAIITQTVMLYVEIFDGYSVDHGFAREDLVMNLLGSALAYGRHTIPGLRELVDFRMEYNPSGYKSFKPLSDYSGQKYLLALKLSGFKSVRDTPFRFLELHGGYYTRGFSKAERDDGLSRSRHGYVGVSLNLVEIFFGPRPSEETALRQTGRFLLEHLQIPHTTLR